MDIRRIGICVLTLCCMFSTLHSASPAQAKKPPSARGTAVQPRRTALRFFIGGGFGFPLSKAGIKEFWQGGPAVSAAFLVGIRPDVAFGLGADAMLLKFRTSSFTGKYAGVAAQVRDVGYLSLYIAWKYTPFWKKRLAPYIGANIGIAKYTVASYGAVIDGVRKTYYDIPGRARLNAGFVGGTDYVLSRSLALSAEAKVTYMFHDPNAGFGLTLLGGFRFTL